MRMSASAKALSASLGSATTALELGFETVFVAAGRPAVGTVAGAVRSSAWAASRSACFTRPLAKAQSRNWDRTGAGTVIKSA